ncbi:Peptidase M50B-like-domain containing protein [Rhodotorula toruloides]|uniref:Peptidase M50B-like-domain containing protein n=1 Tax=Rhodotorula toruloides TaxID=5286 RepID=A0A2T0A7T0_RHOTO|nr:Peptidase M50B-like-domain containing protein [Rhodotorula toruloides]
MMGMRRSDQETMAGTLTTDITNFGAPPVETEYTTWGVTETRTAKVVEVTVYEGFGTTITLTPQVVTYTLVPTSTELQVSTIVDSQTTYITSTAVRTLTLASSATVIASPPSSTRTSSETLPTTPPPWLTLTTSTSTRPASSTSSSRPAKSTSTTASSASDCQPGEADERVPGLFSPTEEQAWTLIAAAISIVGITIAWNLWGLRWLLYSFKSYTVFVHESGHLLGLLLSGQRLYRFTIDPNTGGATHTVPGTLLRPPSLFLGPLFSLFFGSGLVFAAFDTRAAKYASFVVGVGWVPVVALQGNWVSRVNCALPVGLLIGFWFIDHAYPLRFYILFIGVMSLFYVVWDTMVRSRSLRRAWRWTSDERYRAQDDFFHRKQNECCVVMIESNTAVSATLWFGLFFTLSCLAFVGVMLGGLAYWRETGRAMYCEAQAFLPT